MFSVVHKLKTTDFFIHLLSLLQYSIPFKISQILSLTTQNLIRSKQRKGNLKYSSILLLKCLKWLFNNLEEAFNKNKIFLLTLTDIYDIIIIKFCVVSERIWLILKGMLYYRHTNGYVHWYLVLKKIKVWSSQNIAFDHTFDHLQSWTTWKQCSQEHPKAPFSD